MKSVFFSLRRRNAKFWNFFLRDNTIFTSEAGLGFCSALAVTNKLDNSIVMCVGVLLVTIISCAAVGALKSFLKLCGFKEPMKSLGDHHRITVYMIVIAASVTTFSLFAQAYVPQIALDIKAYIGLIITNCIVLGLVDPFDKSNQNLWSYRKPILKKSLGYAFALICISIFRELLGFGTLLNFPVMPEWWPLATIMVTPVGGFFAVAVWRMGIRPIALNRGVLCCGTPVSFTVEPENAFDSIATKRAALLGGGILIIIGALAGLGWKGTINVPYHIAFSTVFLNGIVLSNLLGMCPLVNQSRGLSSAWKMGVAVVFVTACATPLNWLLYNYVLIKASSLVTGFVPSFFRFETLFDLMLFIVTIAIFVQVLEKIIAKIAPEVKNSMGIFLPLITVNCVVLGSSLFRVSVSSNLLEALMAGLGDGLHWAMVCVLLAVIRNQALNRVNIRIWDKDTLVILMLGIIASLWTIFAQMGGGL